MKYPGLLYCDLEAQWLLVVSSGELVKRYDDIKRLLKEVGLSPLDFYFILLRKCSIVIGLQRNYFSGQKFALRSFKE